MNPAGETALSLLALGTGLKLGWWAGQRSLLWLTGTFLTALATIAGRGVVARLPPQPDSLWAWWLNWEQAPFILESLVCSLVLSCLAPQLDAPRKQWTVLLLASLVGCSTGVVPSLAHLLSRPQLAQIKTHFWPDGVCRQSTDYTCGPAAAVTALRMLGFHADEGPVALDSRSSWINGTPGERLVAGLRHRYGPHGLEAQWRRFSNLDELRHAGLCLVIVRFSATLDHWIVVRAVTDTRVHYSDSLSGQGSESHADFLKRWRKVGIRVNRTP